MKIKLNELKELFKVKIVDTGSLQDTENLEKEFLGKNGILTNFLKGIKDLNVDEKREIGPLANELKIYITEEIKKKNKEIEDRKFADIAESEKIDITATFSAKNRGHRHPISIAWKELEDIFISMGYEVADGPQVEKEFYNFDMLNIPDNHPARDVWDTFWLSDEINKTKDKSKGEWLLLRTHTSPVQVRTMLKGKLPLKIISPGRTFRYEQEDARHTCNFYQLEGLVVGEGVSLGDLKGTLETAMKKLFGEKTEVRLRPSIFPFTEPSAEVDITCQICGGSGEKNGKNCGMCSGSGWVELLGAGMVHPKVLSDAGIDPEKYSGFAFGMGIDRIATQKYAINSGRMLYQSKLKLNEQF